MSSADFYKLLFRIISQLNRNKLISTAEKSQIKGNFTCIFYFSKMKLSRIRIIPPSSWLNLNSAISKMKNNAFSILFYCYKITHFNPVPVLNFLTTAKFLLAQPQGSTYTNISQIQSSIWEIDEEDLEDNYSPWIRQRR